MSQAEANSTDVQAASENQGETASGPPERRNRLGWVALAVLLGLMFASTMSASLAPGKTAAEHPYETLLQIEVSGRRAASEANRVTQDGSMEEQVPQLRESLDSPISDLVESSKTDVEAARTYGAMRTEQGLIVPAANLAPLQRSADPKDKALAQIYAAKKLTAAEAKDLAAKLPDEPFVFQIAKVQALEKSGDNRARDAAFTGGYFLSLIVQMLGFAGILFSSGVVWMLYLRARAQGKIAPLGAPATPATLGEADLLAIRAAQVLGLYLLLSAFGDLAMGPKPDPGHIALASAAAGLLVVVALPILARVPVGGKRITLAKVGLTGEKLFQHVLWGLGGFLVEFPLSIGLLVIGMSTFRFLPAPTHPIEEELLHAKNLASLLPILFFGTVTAPIWEEFVFRGLLFPALGRIYSRVLPAALVSAFVFAMVHPQGVAAWLALATVGTVGCALTYHTRSLVPTIVMHMTHNSIIFAAFLLSMAKP